MKKALSIVIAMLFLAALTAQSYAAEEGLFKRILRAPANFFKSKEPPKEEAKTAPKDAIKPVPAGTPVKIPPLPLKDMTREEIVKRMNDLLKRENEIINFIPGLKQETGAEGNAFYTFQGKNIEELDRDTLVKVFTRARTEAVRIRTDRLNKQLANIQRSNELTRTAGGAPKVPSVPPAPPKVLAAPNIPPRPPSVTQPPRPPAAPPAPPRR